MPCQQWRLVQARWLLLVAAITAGLVGCGPPATKAVVRGTVSIAGKALPGGLIAFYSTSDPTRRSAGRIDGDGSYLVPDAPVGPCKVTVDTAMLRGRRESPPSSGPVANGPTPGGLPGGSGLPPVTTTFVAIDSRFSDSATTPLTAEVAPGENSFDFTVE